MIIFGITGGSGSGKTSVSAILAKLGVDVIDTDAIARQITKPQSNCLKELTDYFGIDILNDDGTLKRQTLASIAFSNTDNIKILNKITHKYIKESVLERIKQSKNDIIAIDGAVIIGSNIEPVCNFIVSVIADRDIRIMRIIERDGLTKTQAAERIDAQPDESFYREHSKYVITNNSTVTELEREVLALHNELKRYSFE